MQILTETKNIDLLPKPNEVKFVLSDLLPPHELITSASAFAFAFEGDRLLLTQLKSRGWDLPGGHIEEGESPEEAVRREVHEESGTVLGSMGLLGYTHFKILAPKPDGYRYPYPESYMVSYWAKITVLEPFESSAESYVRDLFSPEEARKVPWIQGMIEAYEAALAVIAKFRRRIILYKEEMDIGDKGCSL